MIRTVDHTRSRRAWRQRRPNPAGIPQPAGGPKPSIGIFWGRHDRGVVLEDKLRERGFPVVHYNVRGVADKPFARIRRDFPSAAAHLLFRTDHDVYFAALCFVPALCVYVNWRLRGKRYVFNCTGVMWETYRDRARGKPFARFCERWVYPFLAGIILDGADRIVCNSRFLAALVGERYPAYRDKIMTIYNGVDADRYAAGRPASIPGVPNDSPVVACVTTLNFENKSRGLEFVIDAFGEAWKQRPQARLVVAAKVSHRRYAERVAAYLDSRAWRDAVTISYNCRNVPDLLARAAIFAFATPADSSDSLPRVLLEAQAAGLPCVATDTTGCAEVLEDGVTGFLVPYDARSMAEKLVTLLDDPERCRMFGRAGRERIARRFTWDEMANRYARVFTEVAL